MNIYFKNGLIFSKKNIEIKKMCFSYSQTSLITHKTLLDDEKQLNIYRSPDDFFDYMFDLKFKAKNIIQCIDPYPKMQNKGTVKGFIKKGPGIFKLYFNYFGSFIQR